MHKQAFLSLCLLLTLYLGVWDGHLALRDTDSTEPIRIFPYSVELYPEADRDALEKGIPIDSNRTLVKLLEDYLS